MYLFVDRSPTTPFLLPSLATAVAAAHMFQDIGRGIRTTTIKSTDIVVKSPSDVGARSLTSCRHKSH